MIRLLVALAGALPAEPESHWITRGRLRRRGRTSQQTLYRRRGRLHIREQPIADVVDAELAVIDLAVLGAPVLDGENLDVLSLRANPLVELLRFRERHDPVVLAVQDEKRAFDPLRDAFERELLRPFERGLVVGARPPPSGIGRSRWSSCADRPRAWPCCRRPNHKCSNAWRRTRPRRRSASRRRQRAARDSRRSCSP